MVEVKLGDALHELGPESERLDRELAAFIDGTSRAALWESAANLIDRGPVARGAAGRGETALALGYVQSGKTTSIMALCARAADAGYRVIVAFLGSTNLLLGQNSRRIESGLGINSGGRSDYVWVVEPNLRGSAGQRSAREHLDRGRTLLVPLLKHAGRINDAARVLAQLDLAHTPVLVVDDEADQMSLNTRPGASESATYAAISNLRAAVPDHLYVQYTATPYAPLLLESDDLLKPDYVEFLEPGTGYVGGREFFIDHAREVIRNIPSLDEQASRTPPIELPRSLVSALASFVVGSACLLDANPSAAPVSMLVHSTARNDVQTRYDHLIRRQLRSWRELANASEDASRLPPVFLEEYERLRARVAVDLGDRIVRAIRLVLLETTQWLVNSQSARDSVNWSVSRCHILIGGNKLDRGFTIEGLTVSYMNRPSSPQVDTLEQRARAFGYRGDQLPYCQFFGSQRTVRSLRDIVFTEYDLRARLRDTVAAGGSVHDWAVEVGLLLPPGMQPTRDSVVTALSDDPSGWQSMRRPALSESSRQDNSRILAAVGLLDAPFEDYGRLSHRTISISVRRLREEIVGPWAVESYSPLWRHDRIVDFLERYPQQEESVRVVLLDDHGEPRVRSWDESTGFVQLFQGRDSGYPSTPDSYPGDLKVPWIDENPERVALQIHHLVRRGHPTPDVYALAIYLGERHVVRAAN